MAFPSGADVAKIPTYSSSSTTQTRKLSMQALIMHNICVSFNKKKVQYQIANGIFYAKTYWKCIHLTQTLSFQYFLIFVLLLNAFKCRVCLAAN